jgi:hypothetical protein
LWFLVGEDLGLSHSSYGEIMVFMLVYMVRATGA